MANTSPSSESPPLLVKVSGLGAGAANAHSSKVEVGWCDRNPAGAMPVPLSANNMRAQHIGDRQRSRRLSGATGMECHRKGAGRMASERRPAVVGDRKSPEISARISVRAESPSLARVTSCGRLFDARTCSGRQGIGSNGIRRCGIPVPVSSAICVPTESAMEKLPGATPDATGANAMLTVHPYVGARGCAGIRRDPVRSGSCSQRRA